MNRAGSALLVFTMFAAFISGCATKQTPPVSSASSGAVLAGAPQSRLHPHKEILVIAHRGASGYRPEHTLEAYQLAIEMGADFIEPDLVMTKDGVLIARHENEIGETTDVATKFPRRKTSKTIDGQRVTGWFTEDFTLKEIKTLRAKERVPSRDQKHNGHYQIPTFREIIELVQKHNLSSPKTVGIYPEMKHPTYFSSLGLPLEPALARDLTEKNWHEGDSPVYVQSFEMTALRNFRKLAGNKLVFLLGAPAHRPQDNIAAGDPKTYGDYLTPQELQAAARLISGIGPWKDLVLDRDTLIADAHAAGLEVHVYTFRSDKPFLPGVYKGQPETEYLRFYNLGVDGVFSDFPDHAVKARASLTKAPP